MPKSSRLTRVSLSAALSLLSANALAQVTVTVDPSANAHAISPLIYGANFADDAQVNVGGLTLTRWGGNSTTRYNYEIDVTNQAADYFFENIPGCWGDAAKYCTPAPTDPKTNSGANAFIARAQTAQLSSLFTIPTMGYVAKGAVYAHPFDCSCRGISGQDGYDPYDNGCGNGLKGGKNIACPGAMSISTATTPAWAKTWVQYITSKFGPSNGKRIYALDNEPALWSSTHRDLRTARLGYDELWQRMRDYAVAILDADPTALIAGPAEWGWPNYFCSDLDDISKGCSASSPDRSAHGGAELMAWLLDQAAAYEKQNGKRILHFLDLHYYPQGGNPPEITRSLWDPSYVDPSWINDKIGLIPRMRAWVGAHYPGTKLAISEYDFYHHNEDVGAVTYAEVLGIFGREGIDAATAWATPSATDKAFSAYSLYRNFDGKGGQFESTSVKTTVTGSSFQAYGAVSKSRATIALVNESGSQQSVTISLGNFVPGTTAQFYLRSGATITAQADVAVTGGQITVQLPGTTIAMLVVNGSNPNEIPDAGVPATPTGSSDGGTVAPGQDGGGTPNGSAGANDGGGCNAAPGNALFGAAWAVILLGLARRRRAPASR